MRSPLSIFFSLSLLWIVGLASLLGLEGNLCDYVEPLVSRFGLLDGEAPLSNIGGCELPWNPSRLVVNEPLRTENYRYGSIDDPTVKEAASGNYLIFSGQSMEKLSEHVRPILTINASSFVLQGGIIKIFLDTDHPIMLISFLLNQEKEGDKGEYYVLLEDGTLGHPLILETKIVYSFKGDGIFRHEPHLPHQNQFTRLDYVFLIYRKAEALTSNVDLRSRIDERSLNKLRDEFVRKKDRLRHLERYLRDQVQLWVEDQTQNYNDALIKELAQLEPRHSTDLLNKSLCLISFLQLAQVLDPHLSQRLESEEVLHLLNIMNSDNISSLVALSCVFTFKHLKKEDPYSARMIMAYLWVLIRKETIFKQRLILESEDPPRLYSIVSTIGVINCANVQEKILGLWTNPFCLQTRLQRDITCEDGSKVTFELFAYIDTAGFLTFISSEGERTTLTHLGEAPRRQVLTHDSHLDHGPGLGFFSGTIFFRLQGQ